MALPLTQPSYIAPEAYLAQEEVATQKSEYFRGEIFMMAGGSPNHNRIAANMLTELTISLRGRHCEAFSCEAFNGDQRVLVKSSGLYTYPDALVVCGRLEYADERRQTIINPTVLVEVLSPSTKDYDRGGKFELYRNIPSFCDYVLIHQDKVHVEYFHKGEDRRWVLTEYKTLEDRLRIESIDIEVTLERLYERVEWDNHQDSLR